jgi:hypothetical protein
MVSAIKFCTYVVITGDIVTAQLTYLGQEEVAILCQQLCLVNRYFQAL